MARNLTFPGVVSLVLLASPRAEAEVGIALHAEGAAAHMVGDAEKSSQFGWGAAGLVGAEAKLGHSVGVEISLGAIGLTEGIPDQAYAMNGSGTALLALGGLRLHPFGSSRSPARGLWIAGGGGITKTGSLARPAFDLRLGMDLTSGTTAVGPFAGAVQILEPGGGVRPEDGRVVMFGLHVAFASAEHLQSDDDRDRDGLRNAVDGCPDDAEDKDGFQDADGCPDPDNDKDGIPDRQDRCPDVAEDVDGFEDADGCPDPDNDKDGIPDAKDLCRNEPEDLDGFEDANGCPDPDNDKDGIPDAKDSCPNEPETVNGYADDDGCPDAEQVRVVGDQILLDDRVQFRVNRSEIGVRSWPLMTRIANFLVAHPEYVLVHIEGYADDTGAEDYNLRLSIARAISVKTMLVGLGVDASRLTTEGYGEGRPRDTGTSVAARHKNRRVEFQIISRRSETSFGPPPAPGAASSAAPAAPPRAVAPSAIAPPAAPPPVIAPRAVSTPPTATEKRAHP